MRLLLIFLLLSKIPVAYSEDTQKEKVIYKYKQYEKFDFEDIGIEGESGAPGDLSVSTRYSKDFKNKLPYRKNFNPEIHRSIERIR